MKSYKSKKIWLNLEKTKWCKVRLYDKKSKMQEYYDADNKRRGIDTADILGCSLHYVWVNGETNEVYGETGTVLLSFDNCGAGLVAHEFMHAVIWSHNHSDEKEQYPFIIQNIEEEEVIAHNLTYAIRQFYIWYWKIEKLFKQAV